MTQGTYLPSQHREKGLPRMRVKNSWFALKGVFTLKHRKQVLAATSNMTGIFRSLLSVKIPTALLFLLLLKFLPFQIVDAFHHIMRSFGGREGRYGLLNYTKTSLSHTKKALQGYFLKSIAALPFFPHFLHQHCFSSPASSFSPALCLSTQAEGRLATSRPALRRPDSPVRKPHISISMAGARARCSQRQGVSFQTRYFISDGNEPVEKT